jgi:VanZ family protein
MIITRNRLWAFAVVLWTGVILFSSTSVAEKTCEEGFRWLSSTFLSHLGPDTSSYAVIHLLADKSVHVCLFLVLALLLWKAILGEKWKIILILLLGAFIGSCNEYLQSFFPGRDPAVTDILINISGTALGIAATLTFTKLQSQREVRVET